MLVEGHRELYCITFLPVSVYAIFSEEDFIDGEGGPFLARGRFKE